MRETGRGRDTYLHCSDNVDKKSPQLPHYPRISLCPRGHFFYRDGIGFNVYCFADRTHAEQFQARFRGEHIDPKLQPKWPRPRS